MMATSERIHTKTPAFYTRESRPCCSSRLEATLGAASALVNSRHHQAVTVERLAPSLEVVARSPDGLVEGVESLAHRWVVGVQWHPERPEPQQDGFAHLSALLFGELVRQASQMRVRP